jgi:hypothetical protein
MNDISLNMNQIFVNNAVKMNENPLNMNQFFSNMN